MSTHFYRIVFYTYCLTAHLFLMWLTHMPLLTLDYLWLLLPGIAITVIHWNSVEETARDAELTVTAFMNGTEDKPSWYNHLLFFLLAVVTPIAIMLSVVYLGFILYFILTSPKKLPTV